MRAGPCLRSTLLTTLFCYGAALALAWRGQKALPPPIGLYDQSSGGDDEAGESRTTQRLLQTKDSYIAEYGFQNFNRHWLQVQYQAPKTAYGVYCDGFGYAKDDLDAIDAWHNKARQGAYKFAISAKKTQAQLDAAMAKLKAERDKKVADYLASRGFKLRPGGIVMADVPHIVRRSAEPLRPLAMAFERIAVAKSYDSESLVGSVAAMAQTALHYRIPPVLEDGRHTAGIMPPLKALVRGWGDCDTKTGVLASILGNWNAMRMVGVAVPGHYLMAIRRLPGKGDLFVRYEGLEYVLVEPAGPAWLEPGMVGQATTALLAGNEGYKLEPFF